MSLDQQKLQMEREAKTCLHFTGIGNDQCKAGIRYDSLIKKGESFKSLLLTCPCFGLMAVSNCAKYQAIGMESVIKEHEESKLRFNQTNLARNAIVQASEGKRAVRGAISCPVCSTGSLQYSIAGYNGHIHARCSTEGCVAWME